MIVCFKNVIIIITTCRHIMEQQSSQNSTPFKIENILNRDGNILPFGYYSMDNEHVSWRCAYDQDNNITSVFSCDYDKDNRQIKYLKNIDEAIAYRDELVKAGWQKIKPPQITAKSADGSDKPLNRQQKRYMAQQMEKIAKNSPFEKDQKK